MKRRKLSVIDSIETKVYGERGVNNSVDLFENTDNSVSFRKGLIWKSVAGGLVLVTALSIGGNMYSNRKISSLKDLESRIESLYSSNNKDNIKRRVTVDSLGKYYARLEELGSLDLSTKRDLANELDTILAYIEDTDILSEISSKYYNLDNSKLSSEIFKVETSLSDYKVDTLAETISSKLDEVKTEYSNYSTLKNEISSLSESSSFDKKDLQKRVSAISHNDNRRELQSMLNSYRESQGDTIKSTEGFFGELKMSIDDLVKSISDSIQVVINSFKEMTSDLK